MFVTTAGRADKEMIEWAKKLAMDYEIPYIPRKKRSISDLQSENGNDDCLVYGKERLELYRNDQKEPFFFHPNLAMVRLKRLKNGESDPLLLACDLKQGDTILDCTMGLGADSIVASFAVGETGHVLALEANPFLSLLVAKGLKNWKDADSEMIAAMRRIEVIQADHAEFLKTLPDNHVDVVYFDPMFEQTIKESNGIKGLSHFASDNKLTQEIINEAKRVARKRVVLKDHFRSTRFLQFGFDVTKRKTSKFHFGSIPIS